MRCHAHTMTPMCRAQAIDWIAAMSAGEGGGGVCVCVWCGAGRLRLACRAGRRHSPRGVRGAARPSARPPAAGRRGRGPPAQPRARRLRGCILRAAMSAAGAGDGDAGSESRERAGRATTTRARLPMRMGARFARACWRWVLGGLAGGGAALEGACRFAGQHPEDAILSPITLAAALVARRRWLHGRHREQEDARRMACMDEDDSNSRGAAAMFVNGPGAHRLRGSRSVGALTGHRHNRSGGSSSSLESYPDDADAVATETFPRPAMASRRALSAGSLATRTRQGLEGRAGASTAGDGEHEGSDTDTASSATRGALAHWPNHPVMIVDAGNDRAIRQSTHGNVGASVAGEPIGGSDTEFEHFSQPDQRHLPHGLPFAFETDVFSGQAVIYLRGVPSDDEDANAAYFAGCKRTYAYRVQGRFKRRCRGDELLSGYAYQRGFTDMPAPWLVAVGCTLIARLVPGVSFNLNGATPHILGRLGATVQRMSVDVPGDEPDLASHEVHEKCALLGGEFARNGASTGPRQARLRKKLFSTDAAAEYFLSRSASDMHGSDFASGASSLTAASCARRRLRTSSCLPVAP